MQTGTTIWDKVTKLQLLRLAGRLVCGTPLSRRHHARLPHCKRLILVSTSVRRRSAPTHERRPRKPLSAASASLLPHGASLGPSRTQIGVVVTSRGAVRPHPARCAFHAQVLREFCQAGVNAG